MVVTNPTDQDINVSIKGTDYFLAANSSIKGVKESHAIYWKNSLHQFLIVSPETKEVEKVEKTAEVKVEEKSVTKKK